jgi:hypothetical protein
MAPSRRSGETPSARRFERDTESAEIRCDGAAGKTGAGDESRTRDLNLGKVALYQLSYSREAIEYSETDGVVQIESGLEWCRHANAATWLGLTPAAARSTGPNPTDAMLAESSGSKRQGAASIRMVVGHGSTAARGATVHPGTGSHLRLPARRAFGALHAEASYLRVKRGVRPRLRSEGMQGLPLMSVRNQEQPYIQVLRNGFAFEITG